jgi:hypothetical protein
MRAINKKEIINIFSFLFYANNFRDSIIGIVEKILSFSSANKFYFIEYTEAKKSDNITSAIGRYTIKDKGITGYKYPVEKLSISDIEYIKEFFLGSFPFTTSLIDYTPNNPLKKETS